MSANGPLNVKLFRYKRFTQPTTSDSPAHSPVQKSGCLVSEMNEWRMFMNQHELENLNNLSEVIVIFLTSPTGFFSHYINGKLNFERLFLRSIITFD